MQCALLAGVIRCIVWTIQGKSAQHAASCDIYAIALRHDESSGRLAVLDEQLLKHSKIPPHAVRPSFSLWPSRCDFF